MPQYFQKPENALKRANEFIDIGKKEAALDVLYDVIKSKKHRNWQKIHEPILRTYLSLCVDLKRSVNAKEGLYQYKLICQQVNILSLEEVISFFLNLAEKHADGAKNQSIELVTVEDLDQVQTPEGILLSSVSSEDAQDRSDRVLLTPWVKFLWEAYRNVLELLRNNNRVERLYHETAQNAFKFCLKYLRRAEFRKLCVLIKNHLDQVLKYQGQPTAINLNNPESLQMHLETRLFQLENAITMELWQEAYRAIEGIHYLMGLSKKPPKPHMMANYFGKVALVFFKADNKLFHAAALLKLFTLIKEQKKTVTSEELKKIGSKVLLATLSIPISSGKSSMEEYLSYDSAAYDKERKLATLLGLIAIPSRRNLIVDVEGTILQHVSPELNELFVTLEKKYQPLKLCKKVDEVLSTVSDNEDFAKYVKPVQEIAIIRMLKQVSQIYETMSFLRLLKMVPFADNHQLERVIVGCVKHGGMQISINHQLKSVAFGSALVVALREEVPDGPHIQSMPSEILRNQLCSLSEGLTETLQFINPDASRKEHNNQREQLIAQYLRQERKEHSQLLNRKTVIEQRKEKIEHMRHAQEKQQREHASKQREKLKIAEEQRLEVEREKREKERRLQEMKEIQKQQVWDRVESLRGTDVGKRAFKNLSAKEIDEMDPDDILQRQYEQLDREKRDQILKLRTQEKRIDHLVRAVRLEEMPLREKHHAEQKVEDKKAWERDEKERILTAEKDHKIALKTKDRFSRMGADKEAFLDKLFGNRHADYEARLQDFEKNLQKVRKERLEARKKQRMAQRRQEFIIARREQKRKEREEQERREKEAEEERLQQEAERKRVEDEERQRALNETARKQREREAEVEEKWRQQQQQQSIPAREEPQRNVESKDRDSSWRGGGDSGSTPTPSSGGGKYVPPSRRRTEVPPRDTGPPPDRDAWRRDDGPRRDDRFDQDPRRDAPRGDDRFDRRDAPRGDNRFDRDPQRDGPRGDDRFNRDQQRDEPRGDDRRDGQGSDDRYNRRDGPRGDDRFDRRDDPRGDNRYDRRDGARGDDRFDRRDDPRGDNRFDRRDGPRGDDRFDRRDGPRGDNRYDRRDGPRGDDRFDRRDGSRGDDRFDRRDGPRGDDRFDRDARRDDSRGGERWGRDDRGGRGFQDRPMERRDDRFSDSPRAGGFGGHSGWRSDGGSGGGGGGGSWRSGDSGSGRSEGRSWQASRVRSDRDRDDRDDRPPPSRESGEGEGWTTVTR